jgi:preprotein translocase subunit YajC
MNNFNLLDATATTDASGNMIMWIVIYAALFAALYFFLIRPNNKKKKAEAEMRNSIEVGVEVTTIGGIMGRVVAVKDDEDAIIIETGADRNKMKMKKWCISVNETQQEKANAAQPTEKKGLFGSKKKKEKKDEE